MRRSIPTPERTSGEVHNSFRSLQEQLDYQKIPLVMRRDNLFHLREGQSAWHPEDGQLCLYTRYNKRLYRSACAPIGADGTVGEVTQIAPGIVAEASPIFSSEVGPATIIPGHWTPSTGRTLVVPAGFATEYHFGQFPKQGEPIQSYVAGSEPVVFSLALSGIELDINQSPIQGQQPGWLRFLTTRFDTDEDGSPVLVIDATHSRFTTRPRDFGPIWFQIRAHEGDPVMAVRRSGFASLEIKNRTDTIWDNLEELHLYEGFTWDYEFNSQLTIGIPAPNGYIVELAENNMTGAAVSHAGLTNFIPTIVNADTDDRAVRFDTTTSSVTAIADAGGMANDIEIYYRIGATFADTALDTEYSAWTRLVILNSFPMTFGSMPDLEMFEGTTLKANVHNLIMQGAPATMASGFGLGLFSDDAGGALPTSIATDIAATVEPDSVTGEYHLVFDAEDLDVTADTTIYYRMIVTQPDAEAGDQS